MPFYLEHLGRDPGLSEAGDAIGLEVVDTAEDARFFFIPSCAMVTEGLRRRLAGAGLVFFDGTLNCARSAPSAITTATRSII